MAGQYKTMFLTISKRILSSTTPVTQRTRPHSIKISICKFTLLTLLLPSLLIHCTTASPLEPMPGQFSVLYNYIISSVLFLIYNNSLDFIISCKSEILEKRIRINYHLLFLINSRAISLCALCNLLGLSHTHLTSYRYH